MKRLALLSTAALLLVAACQDVPQPTGPDGEAPLLSSPASGVGIEGQYIVVFEPDVDDVDGLARALVARGGGSLHATYRFALRGFAAELPAQALNGIRNHPAVAYVEQDQEVTLFNGEVPTGVARIFADENAEIGIDGSDDARIDVDIAIIDTGIDLDHGDLNVFASIDCQTKSGSPFASPSCDPGGDDDNGHGTHVAGSAAAIDNGTGVVGAAPGARLWAVKVLDQRGSGALSEIVAGVDYVTQNADQIEVANMSLGCECESQAMDDAIANSVAAGVAYAVAAGNSDADAATFSPANHPDVLTVSALADFDGEPGGLGSPTCRDDQDDTLADFSNWGSTVEIAAPGVCILSTWNDGGFNTISGTSMASPHAAGALGLLASASPPAGKSDVEGLYQTLQDNGNFDWSDDSGDGTQEPLLDVGDATVFDPVLTSGDGGGGSDTNSPPTASFTFSCTDLACDFDGSGSSDSDGTVESWDWDFGDGNTGSGQTVSHTYGSEGTFTVTLTVTDDGGATDSESQDVTVSSSDDGGGDTAPAIDSFGVSTRTTGPWNRADVTWAVSDADGDLESVTCELLDGSGNILDSVQSAVSGSDASGEHGLRTRTSGDLTVRLTVTDAAGNSTEQTQTVSF